MPLLVIYNPASGDRTAEAFFKQQVFPFLDIYYPKIKPDRVVSTTHEGQAGELAQKFARGHPTSDEISIVLGSGDGTLHEVVNALYHLDLGGRQPPKIRLALVPCGTANALYSSLFPVANAEASKDPEYRLQSLKAFLDGNGSAPLSLAITKLQSPLESGQVELGKTLLSAVVTSTSLHAAILHYSEALRQEHPGLERFKIAAEQNSTKWYRARARLLGSPEIYDPNTQSFVPVSQSPDSSNFELSGPFAYFLSTINVDRLEPSFVITPLSKRIAAPPNTCELLIIRPLRVPSVKDESDESRQAFVSKKWGALMGAYQDGKHVDIRVGEGESLIEGEGEGSPLVEYYRCAGWVWYPNSEDEDSHLLCSDGAINRIAKGGWAECRVSTTPVDKPTFEIYTASV